MIVVYVLAAIIGVAILCGILSTGGSRPSSGPDFGDDDPVD